MNYQTEGRLTKLPRDVGKKLRDGKFRRKCLREAAPESLCWLLPWTPGFWSPPQTRWAAVLS